jgi:hypothetical protein
MAAAAGYDNSFVMQLFYCCVPEASLCVILSAVGGMHDDICLWLQLQDTITVLSCNYFIVVYQKFHRV